MLIDSANAYGVGWFEPFSSHRFSFHILFVADPLFTTPLIISSVVLFFLNSKNKNRYIWVSASLALSTMYLIYAIANKQSIEEDIQHALRNEGIEYNRYLATPTPLNTWLWFIAIQTDSGFHISHRSVFEQSAKLKTYYFPQNHYLLNQVEYSETVENLVRFSEGYYTIENRNDTLLFNDLRFGQITGWSTPDAKFVFHFYLQHPENNAMVIQRGRFENWNNETIAALWKSIKGTQ